MITISLKKHLKTVVSAAIILTLIGVVVAPLAYAKVIGNTIDPTATVGDKGRSLTVTGPIAVTAGERTLLRVTVSQRTTGAVAEGRAIFTGTGETNQWKVVARAHCRESFEQGPATAVAIGVTTDHGKPTDAHQWLVNITLVKE